MLRGRIILGSTADPGRGRGDAREVEMKVLGWLAMVAAVIAIVVGLVAAVGIWVVKPDLQARAEELLVTADDGLVRAAELLDRVDAGVTTASGAATTLNSAAQARAADPVIDEQTRADLASGLDGLMTGPYAEIQTTYAGLKERIQSVSRTLSLVDRLVPGIELPGNLAETLTRIDEAVTQLNATVTGGAQLMTEVLTGPNVSTRLAEQTQRLTDALALVGETIPKIDARLVAAQERVTRAQDQVDTWFLVLGVIVTALGLYLAGLNVLLFQKGRQWAGRSGSTSAA